MNEITIAARTQLVSFSREHNLFVPRDEEPWKPTHAMKALGGLAALSDALDHNLDEHVQDRINTLMERWGGK